MMFAASGRPLALSTHYSESCIGPRGLTAYHGGVSILDMPVTMPASHSDGVSRQRFVTRHAELVIEDEHNANSGS
jgi:hypothetical protein